jgi:hypothetical protein
MDHGECMPCTYLHQREEITALRKHVKELEERPARILGEIRERVEAEASRWGGYGHHGEIRRNEALDILAIIDEYRDEYREK